MKKIITISLVLFPVLLFSQGKGYTVTFASVNSATASNKILDDSITVKPSDPKSMDSATITISGVPPDEETNFVLARVSDVSKTIKSQPLDANRNLVFALKDEVEPAEGKFQIFYKKKSQGKFQFGIDNGVTGKGKPKDKDDGGNDITTFLGAMANANFIGNNKFLSNLTPIVTLGAIVELCNKEKTFSWSLDANPYIGGQIDTKDSSSFVAALMLPGRGGIILNNYLTWIIDKVQLTYMPFGFGLKLIPGIKDSNTVLWQHNLRTGISLQYSNVFLIGLQYTYGFHNTTSESQRFFTKIFSRDATDISYLTLTGQFIVKNSGEVKNYLFLEWRGLLSKKRYAAFTNNTILTFGVRKDLSRTIPFAAAENKKHRYLKSRPSLF